ncbi:MAG: ABC transporter ATP-binding protein [Nanoarchaeota archaeon]
MLEIKNIHAGYNGLEILKGVNLEVGDKEIVAVVGPNGAGKSTVIKSIFALVQINEGDIIFEGDSILGLGTHELIKKGIVYVPQGRIIFGNLTVRENLEIGAGLVLYDEINKQIESIYRLFPFLRKRRNDRAFTLSGGERQMLALARALLLKPKMILFDEPSLGLAPKIQKEIFDKIKELRDWHGISILIVEQNAKKAIELADRTYVLEDGLVALSGGKEILKNKKIKTVYLGGGY